MVSEFSSLTTSYCWVITEGAAAGYDGAEPSVVGNSGPGQKVVGDVTEALTAGRFFRLADGQGHELAIGRLYDPSGQNELAPLTISGGRTWALNIEFRAEGDWQAAGPAGCAGRPDFRPCSARLGWAIGVFAVPSLLHQTASSAPVSPAKPYTVTVQAPGPHPAPGLIASGTIDGQRWQLTAAKRGAGAPGPAQQIFTAAGPAFGGHAGFQPGAALATLAVDSADPVSFSAFPLALTWGPVQVHYGAVRADVTYVAVQLGNGTVLILHPVAVYGVRAVAFAVPVGAGVVDATAYSRHGEIAGATPFNAPNGVAAFGLWLTPGQHGLARASGRIGSGTANGSAWSVTAYLGPWGICIQAPATGTASAFCPPAISDLNSGTTSMSGVSLVVAAGHVPASAAWVIVNQPDGLTTKVWPVTVGGQKLFAFQLLIGPNPLSWTAYDNSGHVVRWPTG